jgi:hypothetical protein
VCRIVRETEEPMPTPLTRDELLALPATTDLVTGGRAFGLGRTVAYDLARSDNFPCKVIRVGGTYRVITADLLRVLEVVPESAKGAGSPSPRPNEVAEAPA